MSDVGSSTARRSELVTPLGSADIDGAHDLVESDPAAALAWATAVLRSDLPADSAAAVWRVRGLAAARQGRNGEALRAVGRSVRIAEGAGLPHRAALGRLTLSVMHAAAGQFSAALEEADLAEPMLSGTEHGELLAQRGVVYGRIGRYPEALECFTTALRHLRGSDAATWRARIYNNRGYLHMLRGASARAEADFRRGIALCEDLGLAAGVALTSDNLGRLLAQRGDIPAALHWLDRAEKARIEFGMGTAPTLLDKAETLLSAGLASEARAYAANAVTALVAQSRAADLAEARLTLSRCLIADRAPTDALTQANLAHREFARQGRPAWAALARLEATRSRWLAGERGKRLIRLALAAAVSLDTLGWPAAAIEARLVAGRVLLSRGAIAEATTVLASAARARSRGTADLRARAWAATAVLRRADGDRSGAFRALSAGLSVVADHAAALGATDLRAHAGVLAQELADVGVELAAETGDARTLLVWCELSRGSVLRHRPVRPPRDRALATELTELRRVVAAAEDPTTADAKRAELLSDQQRLERSVRDRTRHLRGTRAPLLERLDVTGLTAELGERAFVEFVIVGTRLHAVSVCAGRVRHRDLGDSAEVMTEAGALRFALHRIARRHGSAASLGAANALLRHAADRLDHMLFGPLEDVLGTRELVVVPTMALHALPWGTLPRLVGRPVSAAPSASTWLRAARRRTRARPSRPVLVAGPGLSHAGSEIAALAQDYPDAIRLTGAAATADAVRAALDGASLAHLACHGTFRADNAQFSSLRLADGPLMVYDLERLRRPPTRIVLSACDAGLSAVRPGDELMGLAASLFAMGTQTLVASVAPVDDAETERLMVELHRRLARGTSPARALADSQQRVEVAGFTCFGLG